MGIRSKVKKGTKRIGNALGASEILDEIRSSNETLKEQNKEAREFKEIALSYFDERTRFMYPYLKYYYFNEVAKSIHPQLFEKYKGCNKDKELVIVACGPSADKYKPIKGAKHLAINRAFLLDGIKFDYIFMHDNQIIEKLGKELSDYSADKFMAFATSPYNSTHYNTHSEDIAKINAKRFIISDPAIPDTVGGQFDVIQPDIAHGMLYDRGGGTVFSALQFALYTQPKRIYLVGCDCTNSGYFSKSKGHEKQLLLEKSEYLWKEASVFIKQYYPDIEIVSINPVGLKGVFKDIYQ